MATRERRALAEIENGNGWSHPFRKYGQYLDSHEWHDASTWIDIGEAQGFASTNIWSRARSGAAEKDLRAQALDMARHASYVESSQPQIPSLTGNLVSDVRALCGLSTLDLASSLDTDEATIAMWRDDPDVIPRDQLRLLQALRAICATLVGGLGPRGVAKWLVMEPDPPLGLLLEGKVEEVLRRVEAYKTSPST